MYSRSRASSGSNNSSTTTTATLVPSSAIGLQKNQPPNSMNYSSTGNASMTHANHQNSANMNRASSSSNPGNSRRVNDKPPFGNPFSHPKSIPTKRPGTGRKSARNALRSSSGATSSPRNANIVTSSTPIVSSPSTMSPASPAYTTSGRKHTSHNPQPINPNWSLPRKNERASLMSAVPASSPTSSTSNRGSNSSASNSTQSMPRGMGDRSAINANAQSQQYQRQLKLLQAVHQAQVKTRLSPQNSPSLVQSKMITPTPSAPQLQQSTAQAKSSSASLQKNIQEPAHQSISEHIQESSPSFAEVMKSSDDKPVVLEARKASDVKSETVPVSNDMTNNSEASMSYLGISPLLDEIHNQINRNQSQETMNENKLQSRGKVLPTPPIISLDQPSSSISLNEGSSSAMPENIVPMVSAHTMKETLNDHRGEVPKDTIAVESTTVHTLSKGKQPMYAETNNENQQPPPVSRSLSQTSGSTRGAIHNQPNTTQNQNQNHTRLNSTHSRTSLRSSRALSTHSQSDARSFRSNSTSVSAASSKAYSRSGVRRIKMNPRSVRLAIYDPASARNGAVMYAGDLVVKRQGLMSLAGSSKAYGILGNINPLNPIFILD
jgi:hypothetical protein